MKKIDDLTLKEKVYLIGSTYVEFYNDECGKLTFVSNNNNDEVLITIGRDVYKLERLDFSVTSIHIYYKKDDKSEYKTFYAYKRINIEDEIESLLY